MNLPIFQGAGAFLGAAAALIILLLLGGPTGCDYKDITWTAIKYTCAGGVVERDTTVAIVVGGLVGTALGDFWRRLSG